MTHTNDLRWTWDVIESFRNDLIESHPRLKIMKTRVLKDIFLLQKRGIYKFQLDFIDQDVVFFDHVMDIAEFMNLNKINIGNQAEDFKGRIVIPRIILNTNYSHPGEKEINRQSMIASDIKSIFPQCKFILLYRYKGKSYDPGYGQIRFPYDKTVCFSSEFPLGNRRYAKGDFHSDRKKAVKDDYDGLLSYVVKTLENDHMQFLT